METLAPTPRAPAPPARWSLDGPTWVELRDDSAALRRRASDACRRAEEAVRRAGRLMARSRQILDEAATGSPRYFVLRGGLDDERVRAVWSRGGLVVSESLRRRGELLVSMGEEFEDPDRGVVVRAALDDSLPAMLTLLRACDRVESVVFGPLPPRRAGT